MLKGLKDLEYWQARQRIWERNQSFLYDYESGIKQCEIANAHSLSKKTVSHAIHMIKRGSREIPPITRYRKAQCTTSALIAVNPSNDTSLSMASNTAPNAQR